MDTVTLNHEQLISFIGWSNSHYLKQTVADRRKKLHNMGAEVVTITGKGKNAEYTLRIPTGFWRMLLMDGMNYSLIGAEYIDMLLNNRDVMNSAQGTYVKFTVEIYAELATKFGAQYKAVETTCTRIRNYLLEHGYIIVNSPSAPRTHRVKEPLGTAWVTGDEVTAYDQRARTLWTAFFRKKLDAYRAIDPEAENVPTRLISKDIRQLYSYGMKEQLEVGYYRVAKKTEITDNLYADIDNARCTFLRTLNLQAVREELRARQLLYLTWRQEQKEREEQAKAEFKTLQPSEEVLAELRKKMFVAEVQNESMAPPITEEDRKKIDATLDEILPLVDREIE